MSLNGSLPTRQVKTSARANAGGPLSSTGSLTDVLRNALIGAMAVFLIGCAGKGESSAAPDRASMSVEQLQVHCTAIIKDLRLNCNETLDDVEPTLQYRCLDAKLRFSQYCM